MELSIDTSTRYANIGLSLNGSLIAGYSWVSSQNHTVELLPSVLQLLRSKNVDQQNLKCVVVAIGPGGFSALRVGISTAKGLSIGLQIPVVAVNTLEVEAYPFRSLGYQICPVIDMGRGDMITAAYGSNGNAWGKLTPETLVKPSDLIESLDKPTIICGEASVKCASEMANKENAFAVFTDQLPPTRSPASLAQIGYLRLQTGKIEDPSSLQPIYGRQASITSPKRQK